MNKDKDKELIAFIEGSIAAITAIINQCQEEKIPFYPVESANKFRDYLVSRLTQLEGTHEKAKAH